MNHQTLGPALTIRIARPADLEALRRLIELDGSGGGTRHMLLDLTRPGARPRVLVAAGGEKLLAALHLDTGHASADPFEHSGAALEMLRARAEQIGGSPRPARFSRRSLPRMRFRSGARA